MYHFATDTDLISCLLLAEANNELLMMNSEARPAGTAALPEANDVEKKDPNECNYVQNNKRSHGKGRGGYKGRGRDNYSNGQTTTRPAGKETTITVVVVPTMAVAEAVMAEVEAAYPNRLTRPNPFVTDVGWTTIGPRIVELLSTYVSSIKRVSRTRRLTWSMIPDMMLMMILTLLMMT